MTEATQAPGGGTATTATIIVHKEGEEGSIQVERQTGRVMTPADERPDWADGLAVALVAERDKFYKQRLGDKAALDLLQPTAIAFQDLGFIGVDAEQEEVELEADNEYRMDVVAKVLGINREDYQEPTRFGDTVAEAELDMDDRLAAGDAAALESEQAESGVDQRRASGGSGDKG